MSILRLFARLENLGINLKLVDGQLKINAPKGKLTPALIDELKNKKPDIIEFFQKHAQTEEKYASIEPVEVKQYYPLSSAQQRLYFLQQMDPKSTAYNMPAARELVGVLDRERLNTVFRQLTSRHDSLRTSFKVVKEEPVQVVRKDVEFEIEYFGAERKAQSAKRKEEQHAPCAMRYASTIKNFVRPFDLSCAPLLRVGLIELPHTPPALRGHPRRDTNTSQEGKEHKYILMVDMHHIISDGTSLEIFIKEFMSLYGEEELPGLSLQYKDYAQWQKSPTQQAVNNRQKEYWLKEFQGEIPVLNLPSDYPRPAVQGFAGAALDFKLDSRDTAALKQLTNKKGVTLYMVLLAVYTIFLSKLSNQEDIIVGTPVAGRRHAQSDNIIGMFVNTLALRNFLSPEKTFRQFLEEIKDRTLAAFSHQDYPYEELVEVAAVERNAARNPLFDTLFVLQNVDIPELEIPGLKIKPYNFEHRTAKFDFALYSIERGENLLLSFEYSTNLFGKKTIQRFTRFFLSVISAVTKDKNVKLSQIEIIPEDEKKQILGDFNDTVTGYPKDKTIHEIFEEQVGRTPDYIAVIGTGPGVGTRFIASDPGKRNVHLTYNQLNEKSNQLAGLLKERGVQPDTIVGIMVDRSIEMIIGIFGILKAVGAYLSIEPDYPQYRIDFMLKDSDAKILLTSREIANLSSPEAFNNSPKGTSSFGIWNLEFGISPRQGGQLAYIIYTSGSTGRPKGVMVNHRSVVNILGALHKYYPVLKSDVYLLKTSYLFDVSVTELFGWFWEGGRLVVMEPGGHSDPTKILETITLHHITHINFVPSMFNVFVDFLIQQGIDGLPGLKNIFLAGEALPPELVNKFRGLNPDIPLENLYGPTEGTIYASRYSLSQWSGGRSVPIGKPVDNIHIYIFDKNLHLQPINVPGELCISGIGLARGYLNRPELTAKRFINYKLHFTNKKETLSPHYPITPLPHSPIYRTGDLARWFPDGNIEFLGRIDHQVKIRGFRIELGEIENRLLVHNYIKEAVVVLREDMGVNQGYLCGYIVSTRELSMAEIRGYLSEDLPEYMIPPYVVRLEKMPLTPNGKLNRKALPIPGFKGGENYTAPGSEVEKKLAKIWEEVLFARDVSHASIGIDDNFFYLGGHSLKAIILTARVHKEFGVQMPLAVIFKTPTIRGMSQCLSTNAVTNVRHIPIEPAEKKEYYTLSSAQNRFFILQQVTTESTAYNLTSICQIEGNLREEKFEYALKGLITRHETLRTSFRIIAGQPVQRIHEKVEFKIDYHDLTTEGKPDIPLSSVIRHLSSEFVRPFDLSQAPLLRLGFIKLAEGKHIMMFDMHHIITDGTSMAVFSKEFMTLYSEGKLSPLMLQYKDFARWQYDRLTSGKLGKQEAYWLEQFSGQLPMLNIPTDFPRPSVQAFEGHQLYFTLERSLTNDLNRLVKETGTTLNMVLLAVYNILLARYTGQEDIVIGTTIAGRPHADLENIIGLLIETMALRNYPSGDRFFDEFLKEVKQQALEAYENQDYPFKELIKRVWDESNLSRNPVFDAMLIVQNFETAEFELEGLRYSPFELPGEEIRQMSKVDLTIEAMESGQEIDCRLEYCTRLYKHDTMERFARHFVNIIKEAVNNPAIQLSTIEVIDKEERKQLLETFNDTAREYTPGKIVHELFADQAEETPDNIAVVGPLQIKNRTYMTYMTYISYRELNKKSTQLARLLIEKGVKLDTIVGIMVEPSVEMVIGLLGILKAGGAYLPIDREYPEERIKYMIEDSTAKILLTSDAINRVPTPHHLSFYPSQSSNLAYIIYTSGTTGRPKGVLVEHRNLTTYIDAFEKEFNLHEDDVVIQQVSYAFDAFVEELYPILLKGGKLAIPGKEVIKDIQVLYNFIEKNQVTFITCSPQLLDELNNYPNRLVSLRILISGGDRLKAEYIKNLMGIGEVYNTYGPTESTVCATYYRCGKDQELPSNVPIGKPITNYRVYILDKYHNLLPVGVSGELCVAGDGVTRGYLNNPELNAEKFCLRRPGALFEKTAPVRETSAKNFSLKESHKDHMQSCNHASMQLYLHHSPHYPITPLPQSPIYRTGDLARWLKDGNIEFLGRIDRQVKVRGYRIELGEIENQLMALEEIKKAVVLVRERKSGQNYLTAYVVVDTNRDRKQIPDTAEVKQRLARQLPGYMIPPYIVELGEIPLTSSGKVDRKRLLLADGRDVRPDQSFTAPQSKIEKIVAKLWKEVLEVDTIALDDNFFDLGGTSLDIFKVSTQINRVFNKQIPVVALFQHSTASSLARYLEEGGGQQAISREKQKALSRALDRGKNRLKRQVKEKQETVELEEREKTAVIDTGTHGTGLEIAVIGMAGIFPGARHIDEFWENLKNGVESITFFTDDELKSEGVENQLLENSNYVKARGIIEGVEYFDSSFFGFAPVEAQIMDPQMRVFLQCVWHALEDAGYEPFSYDRRIGLYAGASPNLPWEGLASFTFLNQGLSGFMVAQLADKDFMCTHISYKLNLKGPAVSIQTACSTSLVAIHWAVRGLLHGECEMALAGGVSIAYPPKRGYIYQEGMIFSNDAHNRTFDAEARGSIFGDGVGAVLLKPLVDAAADGDHIYAIIKGSAVNNDGFRKVGYTAPSVEGQAEVIKVAQLMAEVEPESITYIEAHGTATPLGDSVEIEALKQAFNTNEKNYCGIGTVKSNFGHLYSAAGVAGFIKTVLALNHRLIPPSLHFNTPNPEIDFESSPFYVNTKLKEWQRHGHPLRAGVSSFGIGGTNAHSILEEAPAAQSAERMAQGPLSQGRGGVSPPHQSRKYQLILLSAKTPTDLDKMTENLAEYLKKNLLNRGNHENPTNPGPILADMAYTLQVGRKHFPYRRMAVSSTLDADFDQFALYMKRVPTVLVREENRPIVFMFCGQGSQYVNMGIDLYRTDPIFREEMDRCFEILNTLVDYDLKEILYPPPLNSPLERGAPQGRGVSDINQTEITQPVVFAFEYALAKLLIRWGIKPWAMIGYSFGEYIAACISGVFSLEDALKLVIIRGRLTQQTPAGAMISVPLPEKKLKPLLNKDLSLAIVNGPTCIVSGAREAAAAFEKEMKKKRVLCVPLNMSQAIHSGLMEPIRQEFQHSISRFRLNPPQIPYISNVTAQWITGEEAANPKYWGDHLCSTVRFANGLKELLKQENAIFIEIGAGRILGMMVRTHPDKKPGHIVLNTVKHQQEKVTDDYFLLDKVGQLWLQGQRIDWKTFYGNEKRYRLSLPGYPFEGKRYWLDPNIDPFQIGGGGQTKLLSQVWQPASGGGATPGPPGGLEIQEVAAETHEPPRNELEQKIARMWQEYMGVDKVSIHDDFFYLNGNSLMATQLMARLIEEYQVEIPANRFYEKPTIAHLAEVIKELMEKS